MQKILTLLTILFLTACSSLPGGPDLSNLDDLNCKQLREKMKEVNAYKQQLENGSSFMSAISSLAPSSSSSGSGSGTSAGDVVSSGSDAASSRIKQMKDEVQDAMDDKGCRGKKKSSSSDAPPAQN